ncbi:MAG: hypothetical protein WDZ62_00050 [Candidatus Pacearchaeota archaeon]
MRKILLSLILILIILPFASAEIIINQQPKEIYNLGDVLSIPVTIKTSSGISGNFNMDLICNGMEENFYRNGVDLGPGEEIRFQSSLILTKGIIGDLKGNCIIKAHIEDQSKTTNEFKISNLINLNVEFVNTSFKPGDIISIEGDAIKENGNSADGFIELGLFEGNNSLISQLETINNGFFSGSLSLSEDMKAGTFLLKLTAYEQDTQQRRTNEGTTSKSIEINQVPTSVEIIFESKNVDPGSNLNAESVLYDQTGEKINGSSTITIKNSKDEIVSQFETNNNEEFNYSIPKRELPSDWKIMVESNGLEREFIFRINEKESIDMEFVNRTITIVNTGNIPYNKTTLVKIGNETLNVDVYLEVGQSKRYLITAPDGEYNVEVISGENMISGNAVLTGNAIEIREASERTWSLVKSPTVWIFMILILGFITFVIFKRGYQRTFVGYISSRMGRKRKQKKDKTKRVQTYQETPISKGSIVKTKNPAELSLSIKGSKQEASIINVHIKNLKEIQSKKNNAGETIQNLVEIAEGKKAYVYENYSNLFFILAPIKTKTYKNEKSVLDISKKFIEILEKHNKLFKQKIDYGLSLTHGTIIAKEEGSYLKFMSLGKLMSTSKKIASISEGKILLDEFMNEKLRSHLKTEKHEKNKINFYSIKEMKNPKEHEKFIRGFLERMNKDD